MDSIGNFLPTLIFVGAIILKIIKKAKEQNADSRHKNMEEQPIHKIPTRKVFSETTQWGEQVIENLRREFDGLFDSDKPEEILEGTKEDELIEEYHRTEEMENFQTQNNTPKVVTQEKTRDVIKTNEIGSKRDLLGPKQILNGVIMSEILNKPKALRR